ncbi:MAG: NAD(P)H-hydrate dehydratase [Bacteroidetes bacterium]|nr:NAD(P)H-hydrate dehydratase [Bacteroidota bacterium]
MLEHEDIIGILKPRNKFSHKGNFGHALLIGGMLGKAGALQLAARACMRSGAGLCTVATEKLSALSIQIAVAEVMCMITDQQFYNENKIADFHAIGIGVGLGQTTDTIKLLEFVLQHYSKPIVIDADSINLIATHKQLLPHIPPKSILTPHPGELQRLIGAWANDFEKITLAEEFCRNHNCYLIIKGHYSLIVSPEDKLVFNITGNAGMATAGSGDVLTGIITSLLAQGYHPYEAALAGVYIHGAAGDIAADMLSQTAMVAGDIIDALPVFF